MSGKIIVKMKTFYFVCALAFLLLFSIPFSSSESKVKFLQETELQENTSEKEESFIRDNTALKTSKYVGNEFLASGEFPKGYSGKALVLTSSLISPGSSYLPTLRVGSSYLHFIDRSPIETYLNILANPDVLQVNFDRKLDFLTEAQQEPQQATEDVSYLDRFQDVSRSQEVHDIYGITGKNVKIGITDSGIDFGNSAISSSLFQLPNGYSASFDPSGSGFAVAPITLSAITVGSITSLPLRGRTLDVWGAEQQTLLTSTQLGINLRDLDITLLSRPSLTNQYKVGIAYEPLYQSSGTYTSVFVFALSDFTVPGVYDTLYVDLSTSLGLTLASNNLIFESGALYQQLVDWSLVDETPYGSFNPIVARDLTGDGINDVSMGALATTLVPTSQLAEGILTGIDPQGRGIAYFYDSNAHGTYSAGTIVSQGKIRFPVYDNVTTSEVENGTLTTITGTAPGVKIIGTKGLTGNNALIGWLWISGLEPIIATNTWKVVRDHVVEISSNSWGIGAHENTIKGASTEALFLDALSSPDVFNYLGPQLGVLSYDDFQGISFVVSSGNGGPGIGTVGNPASASLAFTVGASTSFHTFMGTAQNDVALFSSRGPSPYGYMKPDAVALGSFGFIPGPVALGFGNGTYAVDIFSGTSEAAPTAAGIMALVYEAMQREGIQPDIGKLRTVLKSTAKDLGFSTAAQGAGLVDAFESVSAVLDGEHIIVLDHLGSQRLSERVNPAFLNLFGQDHPNSAGKFPDSTIHLTTSSLSLGHTLEFQYGNGTKVNDYSSISSNFSKLSLQDSKTIERDSSALIPTVLKLDTTIDLDVTLIQIITSLTESSYRQLLANNLQPPRMTLVELSQNETIAQAFTTAYSTTLDVGFPADNFKEGIGLQLTDPGYENQISGWNALTYQITLRTYSHEKWDELAGNFSDDAYSITPQNLSEEYQFGRVNFATSNNKVTRIPIVYAYLERPETVDEPGILGDELPSTDFYRVNQVLATWNWFDTTASAESGDHRYIQLLTPENATHIGISITWDDPETLPHLFFYDSEGTLVTNSNYAYQGSGYYTGTPTSPTAQLLYAATTSGIYYLEIHTTQTPFITSPTSLTINVLYVNLLGVPAPVPSFSQDLTEKISGKLTIDASSYVLESFPSLKIAKTDITVFTSRARSYQGTLNGINLIRGELTPEADPVEVYFERGEKVALSLNWTTISASQPDLDVYIISKGSELNLKQDILSGQGTTPGTLPEVLQFGINESGFYEIYIDYISDFNGFTVLDIDYTLALDSRIGPLFSENSPVITIPTDSFADLTYGLKISYITNYGINFEIYRTELEFENHDPFTSSITALTTSQGEVNLEWSASKEVRATIHLHTVNASFLLVNNHLQTSFTFNSNGYSNGDAVLSLILSDGFHSETHNRTLTISDLQTLGPYITDTTSTQIGMQYGILVVIAFSSLYFLRKVKKSKS